MANDFGAWERALRDLEDDTMDVGEMLADEMVDHGMRRIEENTPVETYHLRRSYRRTRITYGPLPELGFQVYAWTGRVYTEVEYAEYVEQGTGLWGPRKAKYVIRPKQPGGWLAFEGHKLGPDGSVVLDVNHEVTKGGRTVFTRFVMHPGSPGHHMFQIGARITELEADEWSRIPMQLWKDSVEGRLARA